jgi:hypothetical protein
LEISDLRFHRSPVVQLGEALGEGVLGEGDLANQAEDGIPQELQASRGGGRHSRHAIGHFHDGMGNCQPLLLPGIQGAVIAMRKRFLQGTGERNGILNTRVHALAAGRTVNMGGVARQQDSALSQDFGNPVLNVKARGPHDAPNVNFRMLRPALRKNMLKIGK